MFVYPGTIAIGLAGAGLMMAAIIMAMVDMYPGMPSVPSIPQLQFPIQQLAIAVLGGAVAIWLLAAVLHGPALANDLDGFATPSMPEAVATVKPNVERMRAASFNSTASPVLAW